MFSCILHPVDLVDADTPDKAFWFAVELAAASDAPLHIMTVVPDYGMSIVGSYFDKKHEAMALKDTGRRLKAFVEVHCPEGVSAHPHVAHGTIYDEILRAAGKLGCDAIIMASHRPQLKDYLLGPNAARVVRHASQSVFVIRD